MVESKMQRVCFLLKVRRDRIGEYHCRHTAVCPEMLEALHQAGWHNYSLFLSDDGVLVGYLETPDFDRALKLMAASEINQRWQAELAPFFDDASGRNADEQMHPLREVFHLP